MLGEASFDVLHFERLIEIPHDADCLVAVDLNPLEGLVGLDDLPHLRFDRWQVVVGDRPLGPHVVVEALADGRTKCQLHTLEEPHHRPGHHVRGRMPHYRQGPRVAFPEKLHARLTLRQQSIEADSLAAEHRCNRSVGPWGW